MIGQYVFGNMFLQYIIVLFVFTTGYSIALIYYVGFDLDGFILNLSNTFWIGLLPVVLGYKLFRLFYFPHFTDENNYLKNKRWPAFWDTWYLIVGMLGSFIKGAARYITAVLFTLLSGYRVQVSAFPAPYHFKDTLYKSFYGMIVMECLHEKILPEFHENEKPADYGDLQIYLFQNDLLLEN